jgi:hypothetical protein
MLAVSAWLEGKPFALNMGMRMKKGGQNKAWKTGGRMPLLLPRCNTHKRERAGSDRVVGINKPPLVK